MLTAVRHHDIQGLGAVPTSWVPQGSSRGLVWSANGRDKAQTERDQRLLFVDTDHMFSPDLTMTDYGDGLVKVAIDMPGPATDVQLVGRLRWESDRLHFEEVEGLRRSAEFYRRDDGTLVGKLRQPGRPDREVRYTHVGRCRPGHLRPAI